jgi:hypothetical protein
MHLAHDIETKLFLPSSSLMGKHRMFLKKKKKRK